MEKKLRAVSEWERYSKKLDGFKPVTFEIKPDASLGSDGFEISTDEKKTAVNSPTVRGLVYGAYAIIDACRQAGDRFVSLNKRETPHFPLRMLWTWSRLDNTYRHSPFMKLRSVLSHENIGDPEANAEVMRFVRHMASMRINAFTLTYELHVPELPHLDQHAYKKFYGSIKNFCSFLNEWGIDLYLYAGVVPEKDYRREKGETDCPFDPVFKNFWRDFADEIDAELPGLGGLHLAGSLGGAAGGMLYECKCIYCAGKTQIEKVEEQIRYIAGLLNRTKKNLLYDLTTDGPVLLHREVEVALALADRLPANATLTFKNQFQDYEELRYPEHPIFSRAEEKNATGRLPLAAQMQLFGEMRGKGLILSNAVEIWKNEMSRLYAMGADCIVGVPETHPDDAHPAMAEWYAWGRLAWDTGLMPRDLLAEWTRINYPAGTDAIMPDILLGSYMAASNTIYAGGLQCAAHGMLCPSPQFIKTILNETWYRGNFYVPFDVLGVDDEPIHLYTDKRRAEIMLNPRMFLLTKAHKITPALYERLMNEKEAAVAQYGALLAQWLTAEPLFESGDYRYIKMREMLKKNVEDAKRFRDCLKIFFKFHMGVLTEEEINETKEKLLGPHEPCSINTCDESVSDFLERTRMLLLNIPFDIYFNNMTTLPQITEPGWEEGSVIK